MTTLNGLFGAGALQAEIDAGFIRVGRSGDGLSIFNYTEKAQYEHHWTAATLRCRGLIADDATGEILAWPFPKFFNHSEHGHGNPWAPDLPDEPFTIYDKVDGSLAIVFWHGRWRVATRGSFNSQQAQWAQAWIDGEDDFGMPITGMLYPGNTYLAEIVYPTNRIVVNHGSREDLVLLGVYNKLGSESRLSDHAPQWMRIGSVVRSWPRMPLDVLVEFAGRSADVNGTVRTGTDMEGYVLQYESGLRVKVKLAEYVRMHAILTGMNERNIWEVLANGGSLDDLLGNVPDEFMRWAEDVADRLRHKHDRFVVGAHLMYADIYSSFLNRKQFAEKALATGYSSALFRLYDGKAIHDMAWKAVRPEAVPFTSGGEG